MMKPKIIQNEEEYQAALAYIDTLMDAAPGSAEEGELELFSLLVERYEQEHFPIDPPDPIEAIRFRMDQLGLTRQDLIPYIGSQSKVSEVLNRRRPLSLTMIRELHSGLGIPAEVLLQEAGAQEAEIQYYPREYPFATMVHRGYFQGFNGTLVEAKEQGRELLAQFFALLHAYPVQPAFCRSGVQAMDERALEAWQARSLALAEEHPARRFDRATLTNEALRQIIRLSTRATGPFAAQQQLEQLGVSLVILRHLPHTYLDGACFLSPSGRPVIAMTLRHDRLDNFWFTLAHELAHLVLHLNDQPLAFFDDLDPSAPHARNQQEEEANHLASDLLIPEQVWATERDQLLQNCRETSVLSLADRLEIHPAIVAGRIRWETNNYTLCAQLVSGQSVRRLFEAGVAA